MDEPDVLADIERTRRFEWGWQRGWESLPYLLAVPAVVLLLVDTRSLGHVSVLGLLVLLAWHTWFVPMHPEWQERRLAPMAAYVGGYLALSSLLVGQHRAFLAVLVGGYALAFVALPGRWAHLGVVGTGACAALVLTPAPPPDLLLQIALWTVAASAIGAAFRRIETESARRARVSEELRSALQRNAELQQQLLRRERRAGIEAERARMARELHDTLAQNIVAVTTQLELVDEQLAPGHEARSRVRVAAELARAGVADARRAVAALRPDVLVDRSLPDALAGVIDTWQERTGVDVAVEQVGEFPELSRDVEDALLRVVQEALTNVERHARAGSVTITLSRLGDLLAVDVQDDGRGFDPVSTPAGTGRRGMSERIAELGGTVSVESAPGTGTTVNATVAV
ncbi:sensor histidine kinase [Pseudonocardia parietis]|uniref:Signal transduction histidine kinase n=1 Tax=Pseudonocardia parietis TaxID=570936 RepID=A0ABS4VYX7_9PSEU|nr:sensor histidine kinase [Pseudonocardia parietis]MBP2369155.1 signal transduction histidine kinase [Pseudonocardia parietis]